MKILIRIGLVLALIGGLAYVKIKYFPKEGEKMAAGGGGQRSGGGAGGGQTMTVNGYVVKSEQLDNKIFATGTVIPAEMVDLKPEAAGKIVQLNIAEGKPVQKGQLLIKLNDADLQANLRKLEAQLLLTQQSEQRLKKLLDVKGVSQDEYDAVTNQINNIRADMEFTQAQIAKTELKAPFSGVIGLKNVSLGAYISPSSASIANLLVLNPIKMDFTIPEKYANQVRVGETVTFSAEGSNDKFVGKVVATDNQIDAITRTFRIRAQAANPSGRLRPGAFVKVDFNLKEIDNAKMVPTEAIVPVLKGQQVFVVRNGVAKAAAVDVGVRTDAKIQITNGVEVGDTVIITGLMGMKENVKIKFGNVQ
jgi:membrane fusion protein, multidrug efflux system